MLRRELGRCVDIRGADGPKVLTIAEAAARALGVQAVKGNVRAQQQVIALQRDLDTHDAAQQAEHNQALIALRKLAKQDQHRELGLSEDDIIPDPDHIVLDGATGNMLIWGPADRQQKVQWDRMWGFRGSLLFEIKKCRRKLNRLGPAHALERENLTETIESHGYWLTFYNMRLMTGFSLPAWQLSDDSHEQNVLEQRVREGRWPEPPAQARRGLGHDELEALRRGEIKIDAIARDEKWCQLGYQPFARKFKPGAQFAFELEFEIPGGEDKETAAFSEKATRNDGNRAAERAAQSWLDQFSLLSRLPGDIRTVLEAGTTVVSVPAGAQVFPAGQSAETVQVILSGTVRVQRPSEDGYSPPPFELGSGEPCVLSLSSEMEIEDYGADGIAVTDVTVAAINTATFIDVLESSTDFRMFVFDV